MQNINTATFNKQLNQQQFLQAQHFNLQEPNVIDYSLNHSNLVASFKQATPLNLSQPQQQQQQQQQQYQQYQQKKVNYKSKLKTDDVSLKFKRDNQHNDDSNPSNTQLNDNNDNNDDEYDDPNHNLDSSFSNYSYSTEQNDLAAKNGTNKKQKPNNKLIIKQERDDLNDFNNKKRRESYPNDQTHDDDDDDDNHDSEMNDDDDEPTTMNDSKEKRTKCDLMCVVCDSPANGYNFDAVTCESCKAFFRRNAFRPIVSYFYLKKKLFLNLKLKLKLK